MTISKVGRRGRITIPHWVRRRLKIREGDNIAFVERGNEVVLQPLSLTLLDLRGSVPVAGAQDFDTIRKQVIQEHTRGAVDEQWLL